MSIPTDQRCYLDHNATTFARPDVVRAVHDAMNLHGNAAAQHRDGRIVSRLVSDAREAVGLAMGVCAQDVIFNSGGTEGDNTVIYSAIRAGCRLLISAMDHPATRLAAGTFGADFEIIPANGSGQTDMTWLKDRLERWKESEGRPFVSIVAADSETGVIQDTETATGLVREVDGLILIDDVQAMGKIPMTFQPDYLTVSAHKIGGPKGVGAVYVAPDAPYTPLLSGGGQERRRRSGTHNVPGIAGFGVAAKNLIDLEHTRIHRDALENVLKKVEPYLVVFGEDVPRLPNTSLFAVPDASSMTLMMALDLEGVSVSTGTACSSGKVGESRAIRAMGRLNEAPGGAIRVSFGDNAMPGHVEEFLLAWLKIRRKSIRSAA